jgi:hypothetical protein
VRSHLRFRNCSCQCPAGRCDRRENNPDRSLIDKSAEHAAFDYRDTIVAADNIFDGVANRGVLVSRSRIPEITLHNHARVGVRDKRSRRADANKGLIIEVFDACLLLQIKR